MDSIKINEKYKANKKVRKEFKKTQEMFEKHKERIKKRQQQQINKQKKTIEEKAEKKIQKYKKAREKTLEKKARKILGKKPKKEKIKKTSLKKKAFAIFQKYCKLYKADDKGMLRLVDTGEKVHWTDKKVNAGHIRPKKNYPHLAFDIDNVRPITKRTNKKQGDTVGFERAKGNKYLPKGLFEQLEQQSKSNKKWDLYTNKMLEEIIENYTFFVDILLGKHGN